MVMIYLLSFYSIYILRSQGLRPVFQRIAGRRAAVRLYGNYTNHKELPLCRQSFQR